MGGTEFDNSTASSQVSVSQWKKGVMRLLVRIF